MKKLIFSLILAALVMPYLHAQECQQTATATVTLSQRELTPEEQTQACGETFESEIAFYRVTPGALPGIFTVKDDAGKKTYVRFSSGNLQYLPASINGDSVWRFAPNQYDFIGNGETYGGTANTYSIGNQYNQQARNHLTVTINSVDKQADEYWFDLFAFATSGYQERHPLNDRSDDAIMRNGIYDILQDWGSNKIFMGGDTLKQWRTMKQAEWDYLINSRKASDNVTLLYGHGCIAMGDGKFVNGLFLFPDGFADIKDPVNPSNTLHTTRGVCTYETNTFSLTQFEALEKVGVVFLPSAGRVGSYNGGGYYFGTNSRGVGWAQVHGCVFGSKNINLRPEISGDWRCSVRLVQDFVKTTH